VLAVVATQNSQVQQAAQEQPEAAQQTPHALSTLKQRHGVHVSESCCFMWAQSQVSCLLMGSHLAFIAAAIPAVHVPFPVAVCILITRRIVTFGITHHLEHNTAQHTTAQHVALSETSSPTLHVHQPDGGRMFADAQRLAVLLPNNCVPRHYQRPGSSPPR
jgi:hypothetical protein